MTSNSEPPVSELTTLHLKPGIDVYTSDSQTWTTILKTISSQPGFNSLTWGLKVEDPTILILCINWQSLRAHENFRNRPMYEGFTKKVLEIISKISIHHFTPPQSLLLYAQVIETCTFFLTTPSFPSNLQKFSSAMTSSPSPIPGFKGIQFGEVVEKLKKEDGKEEGSACKLFIGWETVEDHMKFRETELFKENVPLLRTANEGVEMFHVAFKDSL